MAALNWQIKLWTCNHYFKFDLVLNVFLLWKFGWILGNKNVGRLWSNKMWFNFVKFPFRESFSLFKCSGLSFKWKHVFRLKLIRQEVKRFTKIYYDRKNLTKKTDNKLYKVVFLE